MQGFKECINCTKRTVEPSCKPTCESYIKSKQKIEDTRRTKKNYLEANVFLHEAYVRDRQCRKSKTDERRKAND